MLKALKCASRPLIVGYGVSGRSLASFFTRQNRSFFIYDDSSQSVQNCLSEHPLAQQFQTNLQYDLLLLSPGIPHDAAILEKIPHENALKMTEVELALELLSQQKVPIVGITGTNGKSTCCARLAYLFQKAGIQSEATGNIGVPLIDYADTKEKYGHFFVELSSFQLEWLKKPCLDAAFLLNLVPDHLDRYSTFKEYVQAKMRICKILKEKAPLFVSDSVIESFAPYLENVRYISIEQTIRQLEQDLHEKKDGLANINSDQYTQIIKTMSQDAKGTLAYWLFLGLPLDLFFENLVTFKGLAHRLEGLGTYNGISYVNDSKATNLASLLHALNHVPGTKVLIAGGKEKGEDYRFLKDEISEKTKAVILVGESAKKMWTDWGRNQKIQIALTFEEAFKKAIEQALPGETILLSPGCSSYDRFKNFEHRGNYFKTLLNDLRERGEK